MGSDLPRDQHASLLRDYQIGNELPGRRLFRIVEKASGKQLLLRQIETQSEEQAKELARTVAQKLIVKCPQLGKLVKAYAAEQRSLCNSARTSYFVLDLPEKTLLEEFSARGRDGRAFNEPQLWGVLVSVVFGLAKLQRHGLPHDSLSLQTVYVGAEGQIKVVDPWITGETSNAEKLLEQDRICGLILCPGDATQEKDALHLRYKGDVLVLAALICTIGLGRLLHQLAPKISHSALQQLIRRQFSAIHSQDLTNLLLSMSQAAATRPDWIQIEQGILAYEDQQNQSAVQIQTRAPHPQRSIESNYEQVPAFNCKPKPSQKRKPDPKPKQRPKETQKPRTKTKQKQRALQKLKTQQTPYNSAKKQRGTKDKAKDRTFYDQIAARRTKGRDYIKIKDQSRDIYSVKDIEAPLHALKQVIQDIIPPKKESLQLQEISSLKQVSGPRPLQEYSIATLTLSAPKITLQIQACPPSVADHSRLLQPKQLPNQQATLISVQEGLYRPLAPTNLKAKRQSFSILVSQVSSSMKRSIGQSIVLRSSSSNCKRELNSPYLQGDETQPDLFRRNHMTRFTTADSDDKEEPPVASHTCSSTDEAKINQSWDLRSSHLALSSLTQNQVDIPPLPPGCQPSLNHRHSSSFHINNGLSNLDLKPQQPVPTLQFKIAQPSFDSQPSPQPRPQIVPQINAHMLPQSPSQIQIIGGKQIGNWQQESQMRPEWRQGQDGRNVTLVGIRMLARSKI